MEEYENNNIKAKDKFNFLNETEFELPNIYIKKMNIKYDYNYEIKEDNIIHLKIKIENLSFLLVLYLYRNYYFLLVLIGYPLL